MTIHVRYCSPPTYKFNISPTTLRADYEVWICGFEDQYFLIPKDVIRAIYRDPEAYPDRLHPNLRVVSVNVDTETVMFARGGKMRDLGQFRAKTLG